MNSAKDTYAHNTCTNLNIKQLFGVLKHYLLLLIAALCYYCRQINNSHGTEGAWEAFAPTPLGGSASLPPPQSEEKDGQKSVIFGNFFYFCPLDAPTKNLLVPTAQINNNILYDVKLLCKINTLTIKPES